MPLCVGEVDPHLTQEVWAEAYLRSKWHLDPSSRLTTIDMGQKFGVGGCAFFMRELGSHLTQRRLGRGLPPCQVAS